MLRKPFVVDCFSKVSSNNFNYFKGYKNTKGQREGPGILVWADKTCYEGGFKEGLRNGHGVMKFSNGDRLYGHFKSDKAQGYGEIKYANNSAY